MTRADRLNAIVARVATTARYEIHTLAEGARKIVVTDTHTGDAVGTVGASLDAAIAALDAKVPGGREGH